VTSRAPHLTVAGTRSIRDAVRALERDAQRFGDEFREQRSRIGATLAAIARAVGVAKSVIWRIEHGDPTVSLEIRARAARVVGGTSRLAFYADASPLIYDAAHARMIERVAALAGPAWRLTLEAPVPGSRRSVDVKADSTADVVLMEVESRVRRWEEVLRELSDERREYRDAGERRRIHVVLVLPPTAHHRALLGALPASVRAALPVGSGDIRRALASGGRWPGDGILWVGARAGRATKE
jgi:transcriptional regulator with XRE-family HTH domain